MSVGVMEVKEALVGVNEVAVLIASKFKDGVQFSDFTAFWDAFRNDADFKAKMEAAYNGYQNIPDEIKDMDLAEGLELAMVQIQYVPKLVKAFS